LLQRPKALGSQAVTGPTAVSWYQDLLAESDQVPGQELTRDGFFAPDGREGGPASEPFHRPGTNPHLQIGEASLRDCLPF